MNTLATPARTSAKLSSMFLPQMTPADVMNTRARASGSGLDVAMALSRHLAVSTNPVAFQFDLDLVDLPPIVGSADDQARLRATASLYLASELEEAGLIPAVEMAAGLFMSGGMLADLGSAGPRLAAFWQARQRRFSASERQAIFGRLFGTTSGPTLATRGAQNDSFELLMIGLAEALYQLQTAAVGFQGPSPAFRAVFPPSQEGLRIAARQLASNLAPRGGGMVAFAARELFSTLEQSLEILKMEAVQHALSTNSVWGVVNKINVTYRSRQVDIASRVTRGKAGMAILAWLAEVLPNLESLPGQIVPPGHPVLAAAAAWLQASLSVHPEPAPATSGSY